MPYPAQINKQRIVQTAQQYIEANGVADLSLARLAAQLNVKAPSLYRHVKGKDGLLREVNLLTIQALIDSLEATVQADDIPPAEQLITLLKRYRKFTHDNPNCYQLALSGDDAQRPDDTLLQQMVLPLQASIAVIAGETNALAALRGAFALVHGFATLELTNQLRRGGDLDGMFEQAVTAYIRGWQQSN